MGLAKKGTMLLTDGVEDTSAMPEVELFATLATGNVTESLQEFFTEYLTSQVCHLLADGGHKGMDLIHRRLAYQTMGIQRQAWLSQFACDYM